MIAHRGKLSILPSRIDLPGPLIAPRSAVKLRHALIALAVTCLILGIAIQPNGGAAVRAGTVQTLDHRYQQAGLLSLPAAARGPVSAVLGKDSLAYRVTTAADGYRATSPGQRFSLRFTRAGVSVRSGRGDVGLALREIGYGNRLHSVGASPPRVAANQVSYALGGGVREWYANGPLGLEQGFELEKSPGVGKGPLTLSLALSGNLHARLTGGGVSLVGHGAALRYAGLVVRDARGRKLRAWVELHHDRILLRIADREARYPLRIDPWMLNGELTASDGSDIGKSVAVSGNTIVVGAPSANDGAGAVYVFTESATGWASATQTAVLTPSNPESGDAFGGQQLGYSVAISGSTIVAGAPYWTQYNIPSGGNIEYAGAVYEWTLPKSGVWANAKQTAILTATNLSQTDYLGASVAVQGSTIVVGAPNHLGETPEGGPGSVYVYSMPAGGWVNSTQAAQLSGYDPDAGDGVGYSVAISGSTIVAGAPEEEWDGVGNYPSRGGVYVWTEPAAGYWVSASATAELIPSDLSRYDQLGYSVAISGSTIVGGAISHDVANRASGTVYVWTLPPVGGWNNATQPAELTSTTGPIVGYSVAVTGATVFSGAASSSTNVQGTVDEWTRPASGFWADETQSAQLAPGGGPRFGNSVAASGTTLVVGAPSFNASAGAAYVYSSGHTVSGKVLGDTCTSVCAASGLSGVPMLVTGTADDGSAVSLPTTTASDGSWFVNAPPGTYTAGATTDGTTIYAGPSLSPGPQTVTVSNSNVSDVNFSACVETSHAGSSSESTVASGANASRGHVVGPAGGYRVPCTSDYTFTLQASGPQRYIVDPSEEAFYNESPEPTEKGYHAGTLHEIAGLLRDLGLSQLLYSPVFPACSQFSFTDIAKYTEEGAEIKFYSFYQGSAQFGTGTVTLQWNQSTQQVTVLKAPQITDGSMKRVWVWDLKRPGMPEQVGVCSIPLTVTPILSAVVSQAAGAKGLLLPNEFTLVMTWDFPSDPLGARLNLDPTLTQAIANNVKEFGEVFDETQMGKIVKAVAGFLVGLARDAAVVAVLGAGVKARSAFYIGEKGVTAVHAFLEGGHYFKASKDLTQESLEAFAGYMNFGAKEGAYPIMTVVIRGSFDTKLAPFPKPNNIPQDTTLAISAVSTNFPLFKLEITRTAPVNPDHETYSGLLPWDPLIERGLSNADNMYLDNPHFEADGPYLLDTYEPTDFTSGEQGVTDLLDVMNPVSGVVVRSFGLYAGVEGPLFGQIQSLAPSPTCSTTPTMPAAKSDNTACWQFDDGRA